MKLKISHDIFVILDGPWTHTHAFLPPSSSSWHRGNGRLRWRSTDYDDGTLQYPIVLAGSADALEDLAVGPPSGPPTAFTQVGAGHGYESDPIGFRVEVDYQRISASHLDVISGDMIRFSWSTLHYVEDDPAPVAQLDYCKEFRNTLYTVFLHYKSLRPHWVNRRFAPMLPALGHCAGGPFDEVVAEQPWRHNLGASEPYRLTGLGVAETVLRGHATITIRPGPMTLLIPQTESTAVGMSTEAPLLRYDFMSPSIRLRRSKWKIDSTQALESSSLVVFASPQG